MTLSHDVDEIIDTLKKLKDADPAIFHHQDIVKQDTVKKKALVGCLLAQGASVLDFQSDGNSNKRLRDHW